MAKGKKNEEQGMSAAEAKKEVNKISDEQQVVLDTAMERVKNAMNEFGAAVEMLGEVKQPHPKITKEKDFCEKKQSALATYLSYRDPELRKVKEKERKVKKLEKMEEQMAELKKELGLE